MTAAAEIIAVIALLETLDLEALRALWQQRFGSPASACARPSCCGCCSPGGCRPRRWAGSIPRRHAGCGCAAGCRPRASSSGSVPGCAGPGGARPVEVVVEEDGFRWNDRLYPSLSAAATAIAGSRWNGPRFFGLRRPAP